MEHTSLQTAEIHKALSQVRAALHPALRDGLETGRGAVVQQAPPARKPRPEPSPRISELEVELVALRRMVEELQQLRTPRDQVTALGLSAGFEGAELTELLRGIPRNVKGDAARKWFTSRVTQKLQLRPGILTDPGRRIVACVGPTGVGKTTTLAKLAAKARLELDRTVTVITLDDFRVGAVEQWQRYAKLLALPLHIATNPEMVGGLVERSRSDLVLIDTVGGAGVPAQEALRASIENLPGFDLEVMLAMPACLRGLDAEACYRDYRAARPTTVAVTKIDEAEKRCGPLQAALSAELPLCFVCDGPRVPEDIFEATEGTVAETFFDRTTP